MAKDRNLKPNSNLTAYKLYLRRKSYLINNPKKSSGYLNLYASIEKTIKKFLTHLKDEFSNTTPFCAESNATIRCCHACKNLHHCLRIAPCFAVSFLFCIQLIFPAKLVGHPYLKLPKKVRCSAEVR